MDDIQDLRLNAEGLLYTVEKAFEEYGALLTRPMVAEIEAAMTALRRVLETDDIEELRTALAGLERLAYQAGPETA